MSRNGPIKNPRHIKKIKTWSRFLNRYLAIGIIIAMVLGIQLNHKLSALNNLSQTILFGKYHFFMVIGLILMMCPPLARIKYERISIILQNLKILFLSLFQNWFVGPILMFLLATCFLSKTPEFMVGLIILGLARCISMVIVWDEIAGGDREYCAGLVVFNSLFQIVAFPFYAYIFVTWLPKVLGSFETYISVSIKEVGTNLCLYLGIPIIIGSLTRFLCLKIKNEDWYEQIFLPMITPITPLTLMLTVFLIFFVKADALSQIPLSALNIALPMILYFLIMFFSSFYLAYKTKATYKQCVTLSLTSASNNFELAIAVCIALFGIESAEIFAVIIGSLIEVPILILLIHTALFMKDKLFSPE